MNESMLKTIFAVALSAAAVSVFAANSAPPAEAADQVVASFERLFTHSPTPTAVADPAASKAEVDPLRARVNAVLWSQTSSPVPVKYTTHVKPRQRN